ncbi:hypothetical protein MMC10_001565 [Thelotrema lepadinum]|nr:hypothetical protein [Thelotrema lepadinum]
MILYTVATVLLWLPLTGVSQAVHGVADACCNLAKQSIASLGDLNNLSETYVCGQKYSPDTDQPPAPDLKVSLTWCNDNCPSYILYEPGETSNWAVPLVSFILAAVIFSTQIPRRLGLKPLPRKKGIYKRPINFVVVLMNLVVFFINFGFFFMDSIIVILDTTAWVFAIMIGSGPFILSGLVELWLDYKVTQRATNGRLGRGLSLEEQIEVLTAVLAGNLLIEGAPANPQEELKPVLSENPDLKKVVNSLLSMLESQVSFGGAVGAAILLYIGSYGLTLATLGTTQGDQATARALAFGIWWMTIVHVSVVSGSLLASNNPSTAAAIVGLRPEPLSSRTQRAEAAGHHSQTEDRVQGKLEAFFNIPLIYGTRYEPHWMWSRGKNKALWLSNTSAWQRKDWFRDLIKISRWGWLVLFLVTYFLVFIPCALAFWIEYRTPPVTVGCRSLTILLYMVAQTVFICFSTWSHIKAFHETSWRPRLREKGVGIGFAIFPLFPTLFVALITTFAGTLMQITGIFQNCYCAASYTWTYRSSSTISLATDTLDDRASSETWNIAGYAALSVLGVVTVIGWWVQRFIRDVFIERVEHLLDGTVPANRVNGV